MGLGLLAVWVCLGGCQPTPPGPGTTGGRIDPYRTTGADRGAPEAHMPALLEYSDQVAAALARDLCKIDEIADAANRPVLELGDLYNKTATPTQDFELIQHRIRGHLLGSTLMKNNFTVVESAARMDRELKRVDAQPPDQTARYAAGDTYLLMGDFFETNRGPTRRYYFEFKLVHLASRRIVFHDEFDLAQQ